MMKIAPIKVAKAIKIKKSPNLLSPIKNNCIKIASTPRGMTPLPYVLKYIHKFFIDGNK